MKTSVVAILFILLALPTFAMTPKEDDIGVGLSVGTLTSVTGKYWLTQHGASDFGVELRDHPFAVFYGDYLWHIPGIFGKGSKFARESSGYLGGGLGAGFWDRTDTCGRWNCHWNSNTSGSGNGFFVRGVVGVEWYPLRTRFGVFGQLAPSLMIYPDSGNTIDVAVGGRYYF